MAIVFFSGELQNLTGEEQVRVKSERFREIVQELVGRYPDLAEDQLLDMAISIDGEIIHTPLLELVGEDSELHFLHRISGG